MRILHVTGGVPIPPLKYGGVERVVEQLALGQIAKGHEVYIQGNAGHRELPGVEWFPILMEDDVHRKINPELEGNYDVLHNHVCNQPNTFRFAQTHGFKAITTFHSNWPDADRKLLGHLQTWIVNIGAHMPKEGLNVIYIPYGIPEGTFLAEKDDYLYHTGQIASEKGTDLAIQFAEATGHSLIISGPMRDPAFFEEWIRGHVRSGAAGKGVSDIGYVGEVGGALRDILFARAKCLLFFPRWEEAFGLVPLEACIRGTPVIARMRSALPAMIKDGVNGFVINDNNNPDVNLYTPYLERLSEINPYDCRQWVLDNFSVGKMLRSYEELYQKAAAGEGP